MDSVEMLASKAELEIAKVLMRIDSVKVAKFPVAEEYKKAFVFYFESIKSIYSNYKNYAVEKNPKLKQTYFEKLQDDIAKRGELDIQLKNAQSNFAIENDFLIQGDTVINNNNSIK
jgi:hypothetical protein